MAPWGDRLKSLVHAWNAFRDERREYGVQSYAQTGTILSGGPPDRPTLRYTNGRTIISSIYNRISIDVAAVDMRHVRLDDQRRYLEDIDSGLNDCLTLEANIDQAARAFRQEIVQALFDKGVVAIVPVDTTINPELSGGFDIRSMRVGEIVSWFPKHVRVSVYNEAKGIREEITLAKRAVAIVLNPLYLVMNEPNSTLQRLIRKLSLLDMVDDQSASGKLDLIVQVPYQLKSEAKREHAEQRRKEMEFQLRDSKYGIAYTDATEKVIQLNRPAENNLATQVDRLTAMLYAQLGLTESVMDGTADEKTMLNYNNRTIEPILTAIVEAMRRTFLTKTARSQRQSILFFRDPFKLVPIGGEGGIADIADKFARNEIVSSNEIRQGIGMRPRPEPKADQLINSNMPVADTGLGEPGDVVDGEIVSEEIDILGGALDEIEAGIDQALSDLEGGG